jgi:NitT/TauT family transport system permease protein
VLRRFNAAGWSFVVLAAIALELTVRVFDLEDSIAAPTATLSAFTASLSSGALSGAVGTTLESYALGLGLAVVVGVAGGIVLGSSRLVLDASSVVIEFLRPIPAVALLPLAIILFGFGSQMRAFAIAFAAVWPILISTSYGVRGTDPYLHDVARTCGVGRVGRLLRVTLPAAIPSIATGIRVSASLALLVCVTVEFVLGSEGGVGSYMHEQLTAVRIPELYAATLAVALLGYLVSAALRAAEHRFVFWIGERRRVVE